MKNFYFLALSLNFFFATSVFSASFSVVKSESKATVRLQHDITGRFDLQANQAVDGVLETKNNNTLIEAKELRFETAAFHSIISLRDQHLKEKYLESDKFPYIYLKNVKWQSSAANKGKWESFEGTLTVKGKDAPIKGEAKVKFSDDKISIEARFGTQLSAFPIPKPMYMGVGVEDPVQILVDLVALPKLE